MTCHIIDCTSPNQHSNCRLSGNNNVNQNPLVMTLVTVLLREHNRRALELEAGNPDWDDDKIFDEARK